MGKTIEGNEGNFDEVVMRCAVPVLVDFFAPWCGPCRLLAPSIDAIAEEFGERARVVRVNTDENRDLERTYAGQAIPTVVLFRGGALVQTVVGVRPMAEYVELLEAALDGNGAERGS
jgi:thioredoxin 1